MKKECTVTLHEKIADRAGRLEYIVSTMARLAEDVEACIEDTTGRPEMLANMAHDYGPKWLDETANLLKELYNRRQGP